MYDRHLLSINKALRFIDNNLNEELSIRQVAESACYAPFYFHRLFKSYTTETVFEYIRRKRVEKAASVLLREREIPISSLSLCYGFSSNAAFTKTFRKHYGVNPSVFRKLTPDRFSRIRRNKSKTGQVSLEVSSYICRILELQSWFREQTAVSIEVIPEMKLTGLPGIGIRRIAPAFKNLVRQVEHLDLLNHAEPTLVTVWHDSLKITEAERVRFFAGITVISSAAAPEVFSDFVIEKGRCVTGRFRISPAETENAWNCMYWWVNANGYKPADRPPFQKYYNDFRTSPDGKVLTDLCIPLQ
jgi:AraC family transcriptional regulator